jgi:hypothetical protein
VNTVINLRVPYNFGKMFNSCATGGLSRRYQLHGVTLVSYGIFKEALNYCDYVASNDN